MTWVGRRGLDDGEGTEQKDDGVVGIVVIPVASDPAGVGGIGGGERRHTDCETDQDEPEQARRLTHGASYSCCARGRQGTFSAYCSASYGCWPQGEVRNEAQGWDCSHRTVELVVASSWGSPT